MSFAVFFGFSQGLSEPLRAPKGVLKEIIENVGETERALGLKARRYKDNPAHWQNKAEALRRVDDKTLCRVVGDHNRFVRNLYARMQEWFENPVEGGEVISPEDARQFWHGLELLDVPAHRWTADYYRERMEHLYEVMRGRESEGVTLDAKPLTVKQAAAVVRLFEQYLDPADLRLDVPKGADYLASSYDGGYEWCEECCEPMEYEDAQQCRKRGCPLREEG